MSFPKLTIVTPVLNQAGFLEKTILSVVSQGYPNLEYIIVDGGSTDGTISIIKKYDKYITHWISEPDEGMYFALQKGFELSTGELMGWINSDDILHKRALFSIAEIFDVDQTINWITGIPTIIDRTDRIIASEYLQQWSKLKFLQPLSTTIQQESTFWKRKLWLQAGARIETKYKYAADLELWIRFFEFANLYSAKVPLGAFRLRIGEQLSSRYYKLYREEEAKILKKILLNDTEKEAARRIIFYQRFHWLLKSDSIKNRYNKLFNFQSYISYDSNSEKFILE